jgi:AraC family transcriptional regulator of adaptative response/methylated-DNA-[protein]-cysteine methyltransferase
LNELAAAAGMSAFHFHRVFKKVIGLTPKGYAHAERARRVRARLGRSTSSSASPSPSRGTPRSTSRSASITEAIYDAGFGSNSRFYESSDQLLGMTPASYRAGGANTRIRFAVGECSLGSILVARSERGVCAILLGDDPQRLAQDLQDQFPRADIVGGDADFERLVARVVGLIESPARGFDLPLDVRGTAFQERVWQALREIPAGATASYADIATAIGAPGAARAVAQACGANPLAVAIPCHRVVRRDGDLSGYRWGVERKRTLLAREAGAPRVQPGP